MIPDGKNCHKFTKSDRVKNTKLLGKLRSEHESIPAAFEMKKSENADIWLGELCKNIKFRKRLIAFNYVLFILMALLQ